MRRNNVETKIYKIINDVNERVYIGQTIRPLEIRFKTHLKDAKEDWQTNKFHNALMDIGAEHFSIVLIDTCDETEADRLESYYIKIYDSCNNGYNSTFGGGSGNIRIDETTRKNIYNMYMKGRTRIDIANIIGCHPNTVKNILLEYGIEPDFDKSEPVKVAIYNKNYELKRVFKSKYEAYNFILSINSKCNKQGFYGHIKESFKTGCIRYGYRWYLVGSESLQELEDKFADKRDAIKKQKEEAKPPYIKCKVCGKIEVKRGESGMCRSCLHVSSKGKSPKPSEDQLLLDIKTMNKRQIALKYNRSASTISYWFKSYGILNN